MLNIIGKLKKQYKDHIPLTQPELLMLLITIFEKIEDIEAKLNTNSSLITKDDIEKLETIAEQIIKWD